MKRITVKNLIISLAIFLGVVAVGMVIVNETVLAGSCKKIYGGGKQCDHDLQIEKKVSKDQNKNDGDKTYSDKIEVDSSEKNKVITFKLKVMNKGDVTEKDLKVRDILPEAFELLPGEKVSYDIEEIKKRDGEDSHYKTFYVHVKIKREEWNSGKVKCPVNTVYLKRNNGNDEDKTVDVDTAEVCFGKEVKITELPKTGSEDAMAATVLGLGMILVGLGIRRMIVEA